MVERFRPTLKMYDTPNGEYVLFADHEATVAELRRQVEDPRRARGRREANRDRQPLSRRSVACQPDMQEEDMDARLTGLVARLEAAKGADRELDAAIAVATGGGDKMCPGGVHGTSRGSTFSFTGKTLATVIDQYPTLSVDAAIFFAVPAYTASLDAAIALVEAKLPGASWHMHWRGIGKNCDGWIERLGSEGEISERHEWVSTERATPALALLTALFHALQGQKT